MVFMEGVVPIILFMDNSDHHVQRRWNCHSSGGGTRKNAADSRVVIIAGISDTSHSQVSNWIVTPLIKNSPEDKIFHEYSTDKKEYADQGNRDGIILHHRPDIISRGALDEPEVGVGYVGHDT